MVFSSAVFLFLFLPIVLIAYRFIPKSKITAQNIFLLLVSSVFYYYGEQQNILLLYFVVFINYLCGLMVYSGCTEETLRLESERNAACLLQQNADDLIKPKTKLQKFWMTACVVICIGLLWYFKYFNFTLLILSGLFANGVAPKLADIVLPLGISFYTFHVLSYSLDVYFGRMRAEKNLLNFASYVLMFPQLVAGPIVRYRDIYHQFYHRTVTGAGFVNGSRRFCFGLAKKVLIANTISEYADQIFAISPSQLSLADCWAGAVAYSLQIYFDFSGYSDMAIGLALLFGFHYKENFNYPYMAKSCGEFWHRWHISLSTWLRDYVYIHMGGSRESAFKTCRNVLFVFFCSGLWHGANVTFVCWGLLYGIFIVLEYLGLKRVLQKLPLFSHIYLLLISVTGWVMFRADSMVYAQEFIANMYGLGRNGLSVGLTQEIANNVLFFLIIGIFLSYDWRPLYKRFILFIAGKERLESALAGIRNEANAEDMLQIKRGFVILHKTITITRIISYLYAIVLLILSSASIVSNSHNPFIYFRF